MWWVLATVLGILGIFLLFILVLSIPIDLIFYVEKDVDFRSRVRVQWLFGSIGKDLSRKKKEPEKKKKKRKRIIKFFSSVSKPGKLYKKRSARFFLAMLRTRGFLRNLFKLIWRVIRLPKFRNFKLNLRIGLSNPADTGLLWAVIGPTMVYVWSCSSLDVQVEPDFERETLQGQLKGELRVFPIKIIKPIVLFVFSMTTVRAIWAMIKAIRK